MREVEVLEPWLTESHWDGNYWDDVATRVVDEVGAAPDPRAARAALEAALRATFPGAKLRSSNGLYRDHLGQRLDLIVSEALHE
ncbi:hypothetical protein [Rhabdothermincola salaria]|uniref:hypothetical protein n=1 Tax=Rhabdothermincola salaria TaxID=2903142 RepID=UPI001E4AE1AC|nr:hypothetical protein [Rhabdothermincola salaria]MCD9625004.1 hypothetical protein [Rhabdothermincola salaria]